MPRPNSSQFVLAPSPPRFQSLTAETMIEFHRLWTEQCEAAEGILERFGVEDATRYLIGEKLFNHMSFCQHDPAFAEELPNFVAEIKNIFEPHHIQAFFDDLEGGKVVDPAKILRGDPEDDELLEEHDVLGDAEKILLRENAKELLLGHTD